jgi:hypothetical protein
MKGTGGIRSGNIERPLGTAKNERWLSLRVVTCKQGGEGAGALGAAEGQWDNRLVGWRGASSLRSRRDNSCLSQPSEQQPNRTPTHRFLCCRPAVVHTRPGETDRETAVSTTVAHSPRPRCAGQRDKMYLGGAGGGGRCAAGSRRSWRRGSRFGRSRRLVDQRRGLHHLRLVGAVGGRRIVVLIHLLEVHACSGSLGTRPIVRQERARAKAAERQRTVVVPPARRAADRPSRRE